MGGNVEIRQHRLKLESTQVGESTRLGKGRPVANNIAGKIRLESATIASRLMRWLAGIVAIVLE
jgi:hypothetical protein